MGKLRRVVCREGGCLDEQQLAQDLRRQDTADLAQDTTTAGQADCHQAIAAVCTRAALDDGVWPRGARRRSAEHGWSRHITVSVVFFSAAPASTCEVVLRHSYTRSSAADSTTATVCCIVSVVSCWGSCRRCRTPWRVSWRGQESSTTSCQCWTNSIGCPWYSVCGSSWWCRWLFSSASMAWHRPTSPTTASLCRPWLVDVRCGQPTPEPCTFHCLNCECWTVLPAPLQRN